MSELASWPRKRICSSHFDFMYHALVSIHITITIHNAYTYYLFGFYLEMHVKSSLKNDVQWNYIVENISKLFLSRKKQRNWKLDVLFYRLVRYVESLTNKVWHQNPFPYVICDLTLPGPAFWHLSLSKKTVFPWLFTETFTTGNFQGVDYKKNSKCHVPWNVRKSWLVPSVWIDLFN